MKLRIVGVATVACAAALALSGVVCDVPQACAATPKVGTYAVEYKTHAEHSSYIGSTQWSSSYTFKIHSYKNGRAKVSFAKGSCWRADNLRMKTKTVKAKDGKSVFSFVYGSDGYGKSYPVKGKAWVKFGSNSVKLKLKTTSDWSYAGKKLGGHALLDTDGYLTIRKGKHVEWAD